MKLCEDDSGSNIVSRTYQYIHFWQNDPCRRNKCKSYISMILIVRGIEVCKGYLLLHVNIILSGTEIIIHDMFYSIRFIKLNAKFLKGDNVYY